LKLEDVHGGGVGERRGCYAREKVVSKAIKCSWACGSLEQSTMSLVGSQAGVLCEMTTRAALADETPPPPKAPSPRRDVNQAAAAAWWGSICLHSHFLDDTATLQPRHMRRLAAFLRFLRESHYFARKYLVPYCLPVILLWFDIFRLVCIAICSCHLQQATPCLPKRWCSVSSLHPMKPDDQSLCL